MGKRRKRCWRKPRRSWSGKRWDDEMTAGQEICVAAARLMADYSGALYWPEQSLLAFADLHLEKGSSLAGRGVLLPPYDTAATLARLAGVIDRFAPRVVIALGDSFHDGAGPARCPCSASFVFCRSRFSSRHARFCKTSRQPRTDSSSSAAAMACRCIRISS